MSQEPRKMSRRKFIYAGVGIAVVAAAGLGYYYLQSTAPSGKKTLKWWQLIQSAKNIQFAQNAIAAMFQTDHPDVTVEATVYDYLPYQQALITAMQAGNPPDISTADNVWMAQFAKGGYLEPLDDRIKAAGFNESDYMSGGIESCKFGGKTYGLPLDVGVWMFLYWNKDLFKQAGLDPEVPPKTWEDMIAMMKTCKNKLPSDTFPLSFTAPGMLFTVFQRTRGGDALDRNTMKATLNGDDAREALQFCKELVPYMQPSWLTDTEADWSNIFASGKAAMTFDGEWMQDTYNLKGPSSWDIADVPIPGGVTYGKTPPTPSGHAIGSFGGWNLVLYKDGKNKDLGWELIKLIMQPTNMWNVCTLTPANLSIAQQYLAQKKKRGDLVFRTLSNSPPHAGFFSVNAMQIRDICTACCNDYLSDTKTLDQTIADATKAINDVLAKEQAA